MSIIRCPPPPISRNIEPSNMKMNNDDDESIIITHSSDTQIRSNCSKRRNENEREDSKGLSLIEELKTAREKIDNITTQIKRAKSSMATRGTAWNVIREQNWVQQTITDRDKRWCPANIEKKLSPADRVGAIDKEYLGKLLDSRNELTTACADSGCTATICIPGTPLKNIKPTKNPIRLKAAQGSWIETTHEGKIDMPGLPPEARKVHICPDLANMSLVSIKTIVDAGCEVLFSENDCIVLYKGTIVWKGGLSKHRTLDPVIEPRRF